MYLGNGLLNRMRTGISAEFRNAVIVNIFKCKGDPADCSNYSRISLLSFFGKFLVWIIVDRLQPVLEPIIPESQAGFKLGTVTVDISAPFAKYKKW